jgi:hemoglobin-like flavoprotein
MNSAAISASFEEAAERAGDITPLVYARLFQAHPELEALFWRDSDGAIKGHMLSSVIEAIFDFTEERRYAHNLIAAEAQNHEGMDVPRDVFPLFFDVLRDEVRAACGVAWTAEMEAAWRELLRELAGYMAVKA